MVPKGTQGALWVVNALVGAGIVAVAVFSFVLAKPAWPALPNPNDRPAEISVEGDGPVAIASAAASAHFEWPEEVPDVAPSIRLGDFFKIMSIRTGAAPPRDPSADITIEGKRFPNQALVSLNGQIRLALAPDGAPDPELLKWKLIEVYSDRVVFSDGGETQEIRKGDATGLSIGVDDDLRKYVGMPWQNFAGSETVSDLPNRKAFKIGLEEQKWLAANEQSILERDVTLAPSQDGLKIQSVMPGSVAAARGLMDGDILETVNRNPVKTRDDLNKLRQSMKNQSSFTFVVNRAGQSVTIFIQMSAPTIDRKP